MFDGRVSWLRYEEAVDDWLAIASIDKAENYCGPRLKTRLMPRSTESFLTMIV